MSPQMGLQSMPAISGSSLLFLSSYSHLQRSIQEEKDLNLPSQKQMLALYRCDEILNAEFELFERGSGAAFT